ncbi:subtilisin family serine protease [Micromonospora sp. Llam0]|uniref:S8 family peptidase n=1 Tax=Micromonospora sp. Llam0 TaxID=2485143 RepID=UPI000F474D65|nr:S8 family peptidase [Micromonospora sp. Llam0]ROO62361.1 subtilisin family serine protease [Micromonospora sp. Llam0]
MSGPGSSWLRRTATSGVVAAAAALLLSATASPASAAPGEILGADSPDAIAGSYIVVFSDGATASSQARTTDLAARYGAKVRHVYSHALRGFAATMSESAARRIAARPDVAYVEQDGVVSTAATQTNPPSWGLDRIDQRDLPLDNRYTYPTTAPTVRAYVIDTGIRTSHSTFGGRASWGTNTTGDGNNTDCNGHGTHVAGTIGGSQYGVAKGVALVAVKVLNCAGSGSFSGVAAGVDWVTAHHAPGVPAVANMSLGGPGSNTTVENAVRNSIADGVVYAIASGNSNANACNYTPARVAEAITVNASTRTDARASFSNYGTCTDIFAPGEGITSAWHTSDTATNTISGTSMAAPHVAGAAALILATTPNMSPAQVASTMFANSTPNKITNPGSGSPNRLLFVAQGAPSPTAVLYRFWNGRDHVSSTDTSFSGYQREGALGTVRTSQVSGTRALYQCRVGGWDYMTSIDANCEGQQVIGRIGYAYTSPPSGSYRTLYRCRMSSGDHFDSIASNCEGQIVEGRLGYLTS